MSRTVLMRTAAVGAMVIAIHGAAPAQEVVDETSIGDIVVTAQRRSENLQDVPIAISAVEGRALTSKGITTTTDLAAITPGLTTTTSLSRATPFIRGIGSASADPGQEAGVATYVDGVYFASPQANVFALNNVARIEVLKGPQGTLFGRNATGGLIQIITLDPSDTPLVMGSASYGNYDTVEGNVYATTGLGENLAADLSLQGIHQDEGWGRNLTTGRNINYRREWSARSKLKWEPDDLTAITASADYQRNYSDIGTNRNVLPGAKLIGNIPFRGTIYDAQGAVPNFVRQENWGASLKISRDIGVAELQSLSAYRSTKGSTFVDQDSSPVSVADLRLREHQQTYQQEFLLTGTGTRFNWTAGLFFYKADSDLLLLLRSAAIASLRYDQPSTMRTTSYAGFAQGAYRIGDDTTITAGLRYTLDRRSIFAEQIATAGNVTGTPRAEGTIIRTTVGDAVLDRRKFNKLTYRLAIDHRFSNQALVYASYSRGFKGGTFSQTGPFVDAVKPETIDAAEIGAKLDLLDRRLRLNVAGFHYRHKDIQLSQTRAGMTVLFNAAQGRVWGADAEITAIPYDDVGRLELTGGLSVLDAKYSSFPNAPILIANPVGGNTQVPCPVADTPACSASGNRIIKSPTFTSNLGINYSVPVDGLRLTANALWYHSAKFFFEPDNRIPQKAYDLVNAQLSIGPEDERWELRGYVRNLFGKEYYQASAISTLGDVLVPAAPRTYGITVSFRFGG